MTDEPDQQTSSYGRFERRSDDGLALRHRLVGGALNLALVAVVLAILGGMAWSLWWWLFGGEKQEAEGIFVEARHARVGDCVPSLEFGDVYVVDVIRCAEPHFAEAYAQFDLPEGVYPGELLVDVQARKACAARFADFVGRPWSQSDLEIYHLVPSAESWLDGRSVVCWVGLPGGVKATGTLRGANR